MSLFDLDKIGVCTSGVCAVHCAALPLILLYAGTLGSFSFLENAVVEWTILGIAGIVGVLSIFPGYFKHKHHHVPVLFLSGLLLIVNSEFTTLIWSSLSLSTVGGLLMAYAHLENLKLKSTGS